MELKFQVQTKISKPRNEVFDAVYNPQKLSGYFTTGGSNGPLDAGTTVIWRFADYPVDIPVSVKEVVPNEKIVLEWAAEYDAKDYEHPPSDSYNTRIEMLFEALTPDSTLVKISESGWRESPKGLKSSYDNCQGWTHMSCCLKAWAEYGINLRT